MTEQEWLTCADPTPMVEHLREKTTDRKLRLFGCACVRRVWNLLDDEYTRKLVEVGERYADALICDEELSKVRQAYLRHAPKAFLLQDGNLRGCDCHQHVNYHGDGGETSQEAKQEENAANRLAHADERGQNLRGENPDFGEAAHAQGVRVEKLLDTLNQKHRTDDQADQDDRSRSVGRKEFLNERHGEGPAWLTY
jgi:hypothetical protein